MRKRKHTNHENASDVTKTLTSPNHIALGEGNIFITDEKKEIKKIIQPDN